MDERVAMAISHWSPRFTTNGVTACDFERITAGLERWADWCAAWSEVAAEHEQLGRDGCANLVPFHRYLTADWVARQLGAPARHPAAACA
jgi:hypothetical protein